MHVFELNQKRFESKKRCFDDDICETPTMMFHGTSSISEKEIEQSGFQCKTGDLVNDKTIEKVISLFKRLKWHGLHSGGYPVLTCFSERDYKSDNSKNPPTFFAESSYRAMLYASRDYAGGEAARAMFYALDDLKQFICKKELQQSHFEALGNQREEWRDKAHPTFLQQFEPEIELDELAAHIDSLGGLRDKLLRLREGYEYGVVYAIDVASEPSLIVSLSYSRNGIETRCPVPKHTIKAKCIIPKSYEHATFGEDPDKKVFILKPSVLCSAVRKNKT